MSAVLHKNVYERKKSGRKKMEAPRCNNDTDMTNGPTPQTPQNHL